MRDLIEKNIATGRHAINFKSLKQQYNVEIPLPNKRKSKIDRIENELVKYLRIESDKERNCFAESVKILDGIFWMSKHIL